MCLRLKFLFSMFHIFFVHLFLLYSFFINWIFPSVTFKFLEWFFPYIFWSYFPSGFSRAFYIILTDQNLLQLYTNLIPVRLKKNYLVIQEILRAFSFLKENKTFIYFFTFGFSGSSLLLTAFLNRREQGLLFVEMHGLLVAVAPLVEPRQEDFSNCPTWAQQLGSWAPEWRLSSCGSRA